MGTYKDFIEYLGISHGAFMIILILGFIILSIFMLLKKLGFLTQIKFKNVTLPKCKFLYKKYSGSYEHINANFQQILQETNTVFKFSNLFGIYYEATTTKSTLDQAQLDKSQAAIGILVKQLEYGKIALMMEKYPNKYKLAQTPLTSCVGTKYPYFNATSLIMIVNRVYPRLAEFLAQKKLVAGPGILQIYSINDSSPHVNILVPLENMSSFVFK